MLLACALGEVAEPVGGAGVRGQRLAELVVESDLLASRGHLGIHRLGLCA
jgi:hypothetical protein